MKKKGLVVGIIILFICSNVVSGLNIQLKNTNLPLITTRGYIQDLIDNASDGDTISIPGGIYYENIIINKSINLVGEDKNTTIIDSGGVGDVVFIVVDWVNISEFAIRNSGTEWNDAGIKILSKYTTISGNNISNNEDGIHLSDSSCNNITGNNISNNDDGIYLYRSSGNNITGNNISNNDIGISLTTSNSNIITDNNIISNNFHGINLFKSSSNIIAGNNISSNHQYGIYLYISGSNFIKGNTMMVDDGILIWGDLEDWNSHVIDISNTVNGKPVIYWKNQVGGTIPAGAGQVILANCSNVVVENQSISGGDVGIELGFSSGCTITGNNISNNDNGIYLYKSSGNNIVIGNNVSNNDYGIHLDDSSSNTITGNNVSNNYYGIYFYSSSGNNITDNNISNNNWGGICLYESSGNNITGNHIISNDWAGIHLKKSGVNYITGNNIISNNEYGIYLEYSSGNNIKINTISKNWIGIYLFYSSSNTIYRNNFLYNLLNAFFIFNTLGKNEWQQNYWNRPRILPKLIFGKMNLGNFTFTWFNIDWHPAKKPTNIIVSMVQTGGYITIQKVTGGEIADITGVRISFVAGNGTIAGYGTYNDIDGDGAVSDGDTISPPPGLTTGVLYTVTMTYYDDVIGSCKFTIA